MSNEQQGEALSAAIMQEVTRYNDGMGLTRRQLVDNILIAINEHRSCSTSVATGDEVPVSSTPDDYGRKEGNSMPKDYDGFRQGMLRAAEMARNEFKRAPEAAKGHDCVYMSGYEDACDHLSVAIAQAAVIDSVRIPGAQPDWQYHIALLLPEGIEDDMLLKVFQVVEHELRRATTASLPAAQPEASRLIAALKEIGEYRNTSMICIDGDNDTELEAEYRKGARAAADNIAVLVKRALAAQPKSLLRDPVKVEARPVIPPLIVTRDGIPCEDQAAALEEFKQRCRGEGPMTPAQSAAMESDSDMARDVAGTCGPARPDDGSECAYGICPRSRDGCSQYCLEHHYILCTAPAPPTQQEGEQGLTPLQAAMIEHDDDMARLDRNTSSPVRPDEEQAKPAEQQFEFWLNNYWPDWRKVNQDSVELMRAAWLAAMRLAKFNELALKGAINYTRELEEKLFAAAPSDTAAPKDDKSWCPRCKVFCILPYHCDNCGGNLEVPPQPKPGIEIRVEEAAKAVYRKYGANLAAFWRDAFAAEARRHGRAEVEQHATDGNCVHCVPICRRCQLTAVEAHIKDKSIIRDEIYATAVSVLCDPDLFDDPETANKLARSIADKCEFAEPATTAARDPRAWCEDCGSKKIVIVREFKTAEEFLDAYNQEAAARAAEEDLWKRFWSDLSSDRWSVDDIEAALRPYFPAAGVEAGGDEENHLNNSASESH